MKHASAPVVFTLLLGLTTGCSGEDEPQAGPACVNQLAAADANNYSFRSTLSFPPIAVQPDTELTFGWSGVDTDFLGHPVDPMADIDTVNVMLWNLTQAELEERLNADTLQMRHLGVIATLYTNKMMTEGSLFDFTSVGMPITPAMILQYLSADDFPPEENSYTVMIASGEELGRGTRMIQGFKLDPNSTNTHVELTNTSTDLEYTVDLQGHTPTRLPAGTADITIDWADVAVNALGEEFVPTQITEVLVAHFSETVPELEDHFLDLELIADGMWRGEIVSGTSVTLSDLTNENGESFTGVDENGTWIVAFVCGGCRNPAPWYLTTVTPCNP